MSPLDDLLDSAGRVPGIGPDGLRNARTALDTRIAVAVMQLNATADLGRKRASRWPGGGLSGWRGKALAGATAVAAAAAAALVTVIATPAQHAGAPAAVSPVPPVARIHVGFSAPATDATAAQLLDEAATAAGSQQGWPDARYWFAQSQNTNLLSGQGSYSSSWIARDGNGVGARAGAPIPEQATSVPRAKDGETAYPVIADGVPAFYGFSWAQLYALPVNDTAALESDLMSAGQITFGPKAPGLSGSWTGQEDLFELVMNLLSGTPASPALREALYKVAATIPGVTVKGTYTDSLGRTGTALRLGIMTMVIDPATGQFLDGLWAASPAAVNCSKVTGWCQAINPATGKIEKGVMLSGPSSTLLITQGPAAGLPKIAG